MFEAAKKSKIDQKDSKTGVFHSSNGYKEECFIPDYIPQDCFQVASFIQAILDGNFFLKTLISWKELIKIFLPCLSVLSTGKDFI